MIDHIIEAILDYRGEMDFVQIWNGNSLRFFFGKMYSDYLGLKTNFFLKLKTQKKIITIYILQSSLTFGKTVKIWYFLKQMWYKFTDIGFKSVSVVHGILQKKFILCNEI